MATEKQIEANRNNAKLSTGPKTLEGKEIVRFNALKHGLRADSFEVAPGENPAEFAARLAGWNRFYAPAHPVQANLVRQAVVLTWKIDRANRFENSVLAHRVRESVMACECEDDDTESLIQAAGLAFFDAGAEGEKLRRYQFALERGLHRILAELAKFPGVTSKQTQPEPLGAFEAALEDEDRLVEVPGVVSHESPVPAETADIRVPVPAEVARCESPVPAEVARCESPKDSAPNKANSPADRSESLPKSRPIVPKLLGGVKLSSIFDKKGAVAKKPYINPFKSGGSDWFDLSIDTR